MTIQQFFERDIRLMILFSFPLKEYWYRLFVTFPHPDSVFERNIRLMMMMITVPPAITGIVRRANTDTPKIMGPRRFFIALNVNNFALITRIDQPSVAGETLVIYTWEVQRRSHKELSV